MWMFPEMVSSPTKLLSFQGYIANNTNTKWFDLKVWKSIHLNSIYNQNYNRVDLTQVQPEVPYHTSSLLWLQVQFRFTSSSVQKTLKYKSDLLRPWSPIEALRSPEWLTDNVRVFYQHSSSLIVALIDSQYKCDHLPTLTKRVLVSPQHLELKIPPKLAACVGASTSDQTSS